MECDELCCTVGGVLAAGGHRAQLRSFESDRAVWSECLKNSREN